MKKVVIFGCGQVAEVVHYYLTQEGGRDVAAFTVDEEFRPFDRLLDLPVVNFGTIEETYPSETHEFFVAVSFKGVNKLREEKVAAVENKGYALTSHVSPDATVWSGFKAEPNTIIMEHNVIQPFVTVGRNVIMWSGNHIGHHSKIEDNCFIASHVVISGAVTVGAGSFVGVNATVRDGVSIGSRSVLGAGALVLSDLPDSAVVMGQATPVSKVPSHRLRSI
ncbi:acetyltransferase [Roseobacter sp. EG26]|uniref:acetyltransferase n=1 Tax=Roseobacter sp. EG26 TaxID=3412477 RepID=UPI003CE4B985